MSLFAQGLATGLGLAGGAFMYVEASARNGFSNALGWPGPYSAPLNAALGAFAGVSIGLIVGSVGEAGVTAIRDTFFKAQQMSHSCSLPPNATGIEIHPGKDENGQPVCIVTLG